MTLPLGTLIRSDKWARCDCLPILVNSIVRINYANELEAPVPFHEWHGWEPAPMCLFSHWFQNIWYWHVFSLQSRDTTMFTPFSLSLWTKISIPKSIQCRYNSLRYFGNMDWVHLAANRNPWGAGVHVSVKSKQMQLASIKMFQAVVDGHSDIYCLLCHINGEWRWHLWLW